MPCEFCERRKLWKEARSAGKRTALTKGTLDGKHTGWYVFSVDGVAVEYYKKVELTCSCGRFDESEWGSAKYQQD